LAIDSEIWLAENFLVKDVRYLRDVVVDVTVDNGIDLADLICAWKGHVEKIERDIPLPGSDRTVWGAHDLVAAVNLRSFLQEGLEELDPEIRQRVEHVVDQVDQRFISYTEIDEFGLLEKLDDRSNSNRGWWWRRIPKTGPVREDIDLFGGSASR
jgi:hypothetical protein